MPYSGGGLASGAVAALTGLMGLWQAVQGAEEAESCLDVAAPDAAAYADV